jgi:hypothetical protein
MRPRISTVAGLIVIMSGCAMIAATAQAQQGYHVRTRSRQISREPSRGRGVAQEAARLASRRDSIGGASLDFREGEDDDPLSHYGSRGRSRISRLDEGAASLGNFTATPVRARQVPPPRHNYFPSMPNRHHCVPGRGQLLGMRR